MFYSQLEKLQLDIQQKTLEVANRKQNHYVIQTLSKNTCMTSSPLKTTEFYADRILKLPERWSWKKRRILS